jgi:hypothetical protein
MIVARALAAGALALALAGGCHDEGVDVLTRLKAKACACKDAACATEVLRELAAREAAVKGTRRADHARHLGEDIVACLAKVMPDGGE